MKNHRFPWLRNRTTDNRKCEKARNIKEKRTIEMFSTVSRRLVKLRSSPRDNFLTGIFEIRGYPWQRGYPFCFYVNNSDKNDFLSHCFSRDRLDFFGPRLYNEKVILLINRRFQ